LQLLASLGLGWVAGVPFYKAGDVHGIVMYLAREGVDAAQLHSPSNEEYLVAASDLIGAAYALRKPRAVMVAERRGELKDTLHRVRSRILSTLSMGISLQHLVQAEAEKKQQQQHDEAHSQSTLEVDVSKSHFRRAVYATKHRFVAVAKKSRGSHVQPPPVFSFKQACWTFLGVFLTLLMLTRLNMYLVMEHGPDYAIVLG
jgi:hypothetical protein